VGLALREALVEQGDLLSLKGQVSWKEGEC